MAQRVLQAIRAEKLAVAGNCRTVRKDAPTLSDCIGARCLSNLLASAEAVDQAELAQSTRVYLNILCCSLEGLRADCQYN